MKFCKKSGLFDLFKPVQLSDQALFDAYLKKYPPQVSELTFTNIFCWAEIKHHMFCEYKDHLLISYRDQNCCLSFLPPVGPNPEEIILEGIPDIPKYCWHRIDQELAGKIESLHPKLDLANSDYIYRLEDIRSLSGKKYNGKRNFVKRMEKLQPEVIPLTTEMTLDCIRIQEQWLEYQRHSSSAKNESTALIKALQHFSDLPLAAIGVYVAEKMVGFAIGEPLNPTTFVEHFEKALSEYSGSYQFLLHEFSKSIPEKFTFLNREQDLGVAGLRKAKESWNPERLVKKYNVICRQK